MKKTEEMNRPIGVEELVDIARKQPEIYAVLKHYCMNRGFAELRRYAKRVTNMTGGKVPFVNNTLSEKQNAKLVVLVLCVSETVKSAVDMYELFHLCDNATVNPGEAEDGTE